MFKTNYPHIFAPLTIRNTTFRNRIWSAPASVHLLAGHESAPNDHVIAYYAEKAKGGAAVITYSGIIMDVHPPVDPIHSPDNIFLPQTHAQWHHLTDAVHFYGAKASLELLAFHYHDYDENGNLQEYTVNGGINSHGQKTLRLGPKQMQAIAEHYADAAENALKCGFDMILIHGGHGLPLSQVLSPLYNTRDDEYGGSLENRMKFPLMILKAIRARVGNRLIIEYRISGDEMAGERGFTVKDCIEVLKVFQQYIDIAHISAGSFFNNTEHITHPTNYLPAGTNAHLAADVKACPDIHIPVLTLGAFQNPDLIEKTLAEGKADIVAVARGLIADAQLVNKARDEKADEIIPCIRCFHCLDYERADTFSCSVNPTVGRELRLKAAIAPPVKKKKVVIIGGGPAGMQAAITARRRGHDVTLIERSSRLGGMITFAEQVSFKEGLKDFLHYQIHMVHKLGIDVLANTEATAQMVDDLHPDAVIVSVGAEPSRPPIPGLDSDNVITTAEAYEKARNHILKDENIVILGGGLVGCETGLYLAEDLKKKVTIIEMQKEVALEEFHISRTALLERMDACLKYHVNARCTGVTEQGVTYEDADGKEYFLKADKIILALGMRARKEEAEKFRPIAREFYIIGDCAMASNVLNAVHDGYNVAIQL